MILIAENLTVTNPAVARAVRDRSTGPVREVAALARRASARYLDVNLGSGRHGGPEAAEFVLRALEGHWDGGLLIDSTNPAAMERAAQVWGGPLVLNGFSGDPGREAVLEVAGRHGLEVVVLLMAGGIPRSVEERLGLAAELVGRCQQAGIDPDRLWLDPMVAPLGWIDGQEYNVGLLELLRMLPQLFGRPMKTVIGLSNLTSSAARQGVPRWLQEVFLAVAAGAGLTHAMVDVRNPGLCRVARALEVMEGRTLFTPEELGETAARDGKKPVGCTGGG